MTTLSSPPSLRGTVRESPLYQDMGAGLTDRVFLLGHADSLPLNDPYAVVSVQEAINKLGADTESPLLRALIEAYTAGARDIFLVAVAPMSEYVEPETRSTGFYETYYDRLTTTYNLLLQWDLPQIIVPVEASFMVAGAPFLTQLAAHCAAAYVATGVIRIGFLGRRGILNQDVIDDIVAEPSLTTQGSAGKFVAVIIGEGLFNMQELPLVYNGPVATIAAARLSRAGLNRSLTYLQLPGVVNPSHADLTPGQITALAEAKVNVLIRTMAGRRGSPYQCVLATDNTVGEAGTDYWALLQMRLVSKVMDRIRALGRHYIGSMRYDQFRGDVNRYLNSLYTGDLVRSYTVDIRRDPDNYYGVLVDVVLKPYVGLREVVFSIAVGPEG